MALSCSTGNLSTGRAYNRYDAVLNWNGNSFTGGTPPVPLGHDWGRSSVNENSDVDPTSGDSSGSWDTYERELIADVTYKARAYAYTANGSTKSKKLGAVIATASTPTSSSVTATTATIQCAYYPNVEQSTCSAQLQYKRTIDSTWVNAGSPTVSGGGTAAYNELTESENLSGLDASTQYDVRLVLTRNTSVSADNSIISAIAHFTTLAGVPVVTTEPASGIAATSANLNGTLDINSGTGVNVYFKWGTNNPPTQHTTADQSKSEDCSFQQAISGLSDSTTYYFQAFASFTSPSGSPVSGIVRSFATPANPLEDAAEEDHVDTITMKAKYGVAKTITFTLRQPASSSSDLLYTGTAPAQADVLMFQDGVYDSTSDNAPARVGSTQLYTLEVSAAELSVDEVLDIVIHDAVGTAFRDLHIRILVGEAYSYLELDPATGEMADTTGFTAKGFGTGHGASFVAGATGLDIDGIIGQHFVRSGAIGTGGANPILDSGASGTNDYYNGCIIEIVSGTGAGQARVVKDYNGGTKAVTPDTAWVTNPGTGAIYLLRGGARTWQLPPTDAELSAIPAATASAGEKQQFLFQRFAFAIDQTATTQTLYMADSATPLGTRSASDNGTTQTLGKVS